MSNKELDSLMRHVLVDTIKNYAESITNDSDVFLPTVSYRRQIKLMLYNPLRWAKRRMTPIWLNVIRTAAMIAIAVSITLGCLFAFNPSVRAVVKRWVLEVYEQYFVYKFNGERDSAEMQDYEIAELPDGYSEYKRNKYPGTVHVVYKNSKGESIYLRYVSMENGHLSSFTINEEIPHNVIVVNVNGMEGEYWENSIPGEMNTLMWIDQVANLQFILDANLPYMDIMHIGNSVSLCKDTKI